MMQANKLYLQNLLLHKMSSILSRDNDYCHNCSDFVLDNFTHQLALILCFDENTPQTSKNECGAPFLSLITENIG